MMNKWVLGGVLVGILLTLGVQWGMQKYEVSKAQARLSAYHQAYSQATDKNAFMDEYFSNKPGVKVALSTSNAAVPGETGDTDMEICQNMLNFLDENGATIRGMESGEIGVISRNEGVEATYDRFRDLRCFEVLDGTFKGRGPGEINN